MAEPLFRDVPGLLAALKGRGDRPALTFYRGRERAGRLSYAELSAEVEHLAAGLEREGGLRVGDRVCVLSPNRLEIPVLVLALMRLGAVVVPLNPTAPPEDWEYILGHSGARALCATTELLAAVPASVRPELVWTIGDTLPRGGTLGPAVDHAESPAVVLYTSGTTGRPKGVVLRQRNLVANAVSMAENFELKETCQLAVLPLYHAHTFGFGLMTALCTSGHLVFTERLEPFTWAEVMRAERVTVTSVVPSHLPILLAARVTREKTETLRRMLVSSAPLPAQLAREFEEKTKIPLTLGWGLSEYTNFACCVPAGLTDDERARFLFEWEVPSIGPALRGTEVKVVLPDGTDAAADERGELFVRGHSMMRGYLHDDATTARTITEDGWLRTGDEGTYREHDGRRIYFVTGRLKEIIIRDAEKYSPLALERRLTLAVPELLGKLVVLGFPHATHGEEIGAYVELPALDEGLRARLAAALDAMPAAERPKVVLSGDRAIARTHTGKVQRGKMQAWFERYRDHKGPVVWAPVS